MSVVGVVVLKAAGEGRIDVVGGPRGAVGIGPDGQNGATADAVLSVPGEGRHPGQFLPEGTLARQIFGADFGAGQVHAIAQRIHPRPAQVHGVDQFVVERLVHHAFVGHVLLADEDFGLEAQVRRPLPGPSKLFAHLGCCALTLLVRRRHYRRFRSLVVGGITLRLGRRHRRRCHAFFHDQAKATGLRLCALGTANEVGGWRAAGIDQRLQ